MNHSDMPEIFTVDLQEEVQENGGKTFSATFGGKYSFVAAEQDEHPDPYGEVDAKVFLTVGKKQKPIEMNCKVEVLPDPLDDIWDSQKK